MRNGSEITLRLSNSDLTGFDHFLFTQSQLNKIEKSKVNGVGCDITFSETQVKKHRSLNSGEGLFIHGTKGEGLFLHGKGASEEMKKQVVKGIIGNKGQSEIKGQCRALTPQCTGKTWEQLRSGNGLFIQGSANKKKSFTL